MDWFNFGKEYATAAYYHPAYLTYMQSTSCKMPNGINLKLESRLLGEIATISAIQMTTLLLQRWRGTKERLDEGERGE